MVKKKIKRFIKRFGKFDTERKDDLNFIVEVTTWDGKIPVWIITPKHPTKKQKEDTANFLLGELDDHDGYEEYFEKLKEFKNGN